MCVFLLRAVWGEPTSTAGPADAAGGVSGGAAGGGDAAMPAAAVLRQWQSRLGGQVGRDEVPVRPGTDGVSAPTLKGQDTIWCRKPTGAFNKQQGDSKHVAFSTGEIPLRANGNKSKNNKSFLYFDL